MLLLGNAGAGKSLLLLQVCCRVGHRFLHRPTTKPFLAFAQLSTGTARPTHTSLVPNLAGIQVPGEGGNAKTVHLVDIPGHERLRR